MSRLEHIDLVDLHPAADNPRRLTDVDDEMVATVKALGVLEPLIVSHSKTNGYTVVAGHRRLAAAKKAGLKHVPCVVHDDLSDRDRAEMMLVENLQREDLAPLEEAAAYQRLVDLGHRQRELAKVVGRSQSHISKRTALLKLPEKARAALDSGGITIEVAQDVVKLPAATAAGLFAKGMPRAWDVESAVRKHDAEQKTEAVRRELTKAGVAIVDRHDQGRKIWDHILDRLGLDEDAHSSEPCHAAALDYGGRFDLLCLQPERHAPDGESELRARSDDEEDDDAEYVPPAETAEQKTARLERQSAAKAEEAERAERQRLIDRRLDFAATIVAKADLGDVVEVMAMALAANVYIDAAAEDGCVVRLVGLGDVDWQQRVEKVRAFVDESDRNRARFVAATAFSALETIATDWYGDDEESLGQARRYLGWLVARGYEPSDVDREILGTDEAPAIVEGHEASIEPLGKAKPPRKWRVRCSCGDLDAQQTSEALAKERHATHLADVGWEQG